MVKAKLIIDEKEINVLMFSFGFNKGTDTNGRPSKKPVFVGLQLVIEARKDLNLADWSFASNQTKQLELHIYPVIMGGKTRKLYFYDCHLVGWKNVFSSTGSNPMSETLEITCAGVEDSTSTTEYSAYWRKTFKQDNVELTAINHEEEEKISEIYFTDLNGNKIDDPIIGTDVFLVIKSNNLSGQSVDIDISDKEKDFVYKEQVLENDILENLIINGSTQKEKLTVIAQNY